LLLGISCQCFASVSASPSRSVPLGFPSAIRVWGATGAGGADGGGCSLSSPALRRSAVKRFFPPSLPAFGGFSLLQPGLGEGLAVSCQDALPRCTQRGSVPCLAAAWTGMGISIFPGTLAPLPARVRGRRSRALQTTAKESERQRA